VTTNGQVTDELVLGIVRAALARVLELDPVTIHPATRLAEDLHADSLALVEVVEIVEEELSPYAPGFRIDDDHIEDLCTVRGAVDYAMTRLVVGR
jgi:acyl carrier protein